MYMKSPASYTSITPSYIKLLTATDDEAELTLQLDIEVGDDFDLAESERVALLDIYVQADFWRDYMLAKRGIANSRIICITLTYK